MHGVCNCINSSSASWSIFGGVASFKIKITATWNLLFFMRYNFLISKSCLRGVMRFLSVSPIYMFDTGHLALTWTIGPGKWTLYSLAQSKTIQRYTVIGGGTKGDIEGEILSTKFIQNFTWISGKFFFNKFMQTAVIILFRIMKRKYFFSQNNDKNEKKDLEANVSPLTTPITPTDCSNLSIS